MSVQRSRMAVSASALILLAGCASTQLNYNTLELASTVGNLQTNQVLANLSLFIDNSAALPAHVDLSAGNASTSYSVNPSVTTPLSVVTGTLNQLTRTLSSAPSTVAQVQNTTSRAATSFSVTATDAWAQSWSYSPIIDSDELRRLRALYAYAVGAISDQRFIDEYPLVRRPQTLSYTNVKAGGAVDVSPYCPNLGFRSKTSSDPETQVTETDIAKKTTKTTIKPTIAPSDCDKVAIQTQIPDEQFLHEPSCIICMENKYGLYVGRATPLRINRKLAGYLHGGWLLNENDANMPDVLLLGHFGSHTLYIRKEDEWKLSEFTLFVLTATAQSTVGAASSGSGGGPSASGKKQGPAVAPAAGTPVPTLPLGAPLITQ